MRAPIVGLVVEAGPALIVGVHGLLLIVLIEDKQRRYESFRKMDPH